MNKSNSMPPKMMGMMQMGKYMRGMSQMKKPMPNEGGMMAAIKRKLSKHSK